MMAIFKRVTWLGFFAAALTFAGAVHVAHAQNQGGNSQGGGGHHGAPGPLIGSGLPALVLVGGAAYLVFRRARKV